uniref:Uncharacterized protein n=1 Tax=Knipowitschia caucasica TaxID=637954 RepID=A0AAV2KYT8_KNICA
MSGRIVGLEPIDLIRLEPWKPGPCLPGPARLEVLDDSRDLEDTHQDVHSSSLRGSANCRSLASGLRGMRGRIVGLKPIDLIRLEPWKPGPCSPGPARLEVLDDSRDLEVTHQDFHISSQRRAAIIKHRENAQEEDRKLWLRHVSE